MVDGLARQFAELYVRMHATGGAGLPEHRASQRRTIERVAEQLGDDRLSRVQARLDTLTDDSVVCHGADEHTSSVTA